MTAATYALKVVKPVAMTTAMLVSSDVPENDYAAWSSGTTYTAGARVILTSTHKVYESLQSSNTNHDPVTALTWWVEVGPTNRWKVFDTSNSTQTTQADTISYRITPGLVVNNVSVLNMTGVDTVRVRMIDPTYGTVYDKTTPLLSHPDIVGWWEWFFSIRSVAELSVQADLPSYPEADILIDLTGGGEMSVGVILFGQIRSIGLGVNLGANVGIQDYSRKETNEFGDTVLVRRAFSKRASFGMLLEKKDVDSTVSYLADVRATPCLWIGHGDYESTIIFGIYKDFQVSISYPTHSDCTLELEGLT